MSVKEDVDALVEAATTLRVRLQAERQTLIDRLLELDGQIGRLPGGEQVERPTSLDEWRQRRRQLLAHEVGRPGQPINSRDVIHATAVFYGAVCYVFVRFFAFLLLWSTHLGLRLGLWRHSAQRPPARVLAAVAPVAPLMV